MKKNKTGHDNKTGAAENEKRGHRSLDVVEKTDQCTSCQRYMKLGKGEYCFSVTGADINIAEVISWSQERCSHYLKMASPFLAACKQ